ARRYALADFTAGLRQGRALHDHISCQQGSDRKSRPDRTWPDFRRSRQGVAECGGIPPQAPAKTTKVTSGLATGKMANMPCPDNHPVTPTLLFDALHCPQRPGLNLDH